MKKKRKKRFESVKDWTKLKKGDTIKVIAGTGPYTIIDNKKIYIGVSSGNYVVHSISTDGIHIYEGINHNFLYMGEEKKSLVGFSAAHKIKKCLTS